MSYSSAPVPNPTFIPASTGWTTQAYCFSAPSALWTIAELAATLVSAAAGLFLGWLVSDATGGASKWILKFLATLTKAIPGSLPAEFIAFIDVMPADAASALLGAILAATSVTLYLKSAECNCKPGRKALCFCVTSAGPVPILVLPCGGACPAVPAGCP